MLKFYCTPLLVNHGPGLGICIEDKCIAAFTLCWRSSPRLTGLCQLRYTPLLYSDSTCGSLEPKDSFLSKNHCLPAYSFLEFHGVFFSCGVLVSWIFLQDLLRGPRTSGGNRKGAESRPFPSLSGVTKAPLPISFYLEKRGETSWPLRPRLWGAWSLPSHVVCPGQKAR